jgi:hypothetical protein
LELDDGCLMLDDGYGWRKCDVGIMDVGCWMIDSSI